MWRRGHNILFVIHLDILVLQSLAMTNNHYTTIITTTTIASCFCCHSFTSLVLRPMLFSLRGQGKTKITNHHDNQDRSVEDSSGTRKLTPSYSLGAGKVSTPTTSTTAAAVSGSSTISLTPSHGLLVGNCGNPSSTDILCATGLVCFRRSGDFQPAPGCPQASSDPSATNYCVDAILVATTNTNTNSVPPPFFSIRTMIGRDMTSIMNHFASPSSPVHIQGRSGICHSRHLPISSSYNEWQLFLAWKK